MINPEKADQILQTLYENEVMSEHDLENLAFLLTSDRQTLLEWFDIVGVEDQRYAKTILQIAHNYFVDTAKIIDTTQAQQVLKKFMS